METATDRRMGSPYPKSSLFLERNGIDPQEVAEIGITAEGYYRFLFAEETQSHSVVKFEWTEWPNKEIGLKVIAAMREDRKDGGYDD